MSTKPKSAGKGAYREFYEAVAPMSPEQLATIQEFFNDFSRFVANPCDS